MKKILKAATWDTDTAFTSENVADKSHWFVKLCDAALTALDIGTYTITYQSTSGITITTANYGTITLYKPGRYVATPYIAYVNSETKELCMCASYDRVETFTQMGSSSNAGNYVRGVVKTDNSSTMRTLSCVGGFIALKFTNGTIIGISTSSTLGSYGNNCLTINSYGCSLPERKETLATPIVSVNEGYSRKAIINYSGNLAAYANSYYESIYDTEHYYLGAVYSSTDKKFMYNGIAFDIDDSTHIETV